MVTISNIQSSMFFLTNLPDIEVSATTDKIHVLVELTADNLSEVPIDQSYFTSNNGFTIYDVADLCKSFMESHSLVHCSCHLTVTEEPRSYDVWGDDIDEKTFEVFYESIATGRDVSHINDYFLVSTDKKILYKQSTLSEFIGYVNVESSVLQSNVKSLTTFAVCKLNDGTTSLVQIQASIDMSGVLIYTGSVTLSYNSILQAAKAVNQNVVDVMSFRLELDSRIISYVVSDEDTENLQFFKFSNEFGFAETVAIAGVTKEVNDYSQSVAVSGHTRIKYDANVEQSFQFQSAALPSFVEPSVSSLLMAKSLTVWFAHAVAKPILVVDSTWEKSNEIGTVNSVKFTYKFTDDRMVKYTSGAITRIFDNVYDNTYG